MRRWHVAHTRPNSEERAITNLRRQGFEVYMPRYLAKRRHARRVETVSRPFFPRYLFVHIDPALESWRSINSTYGILNIIAQGNVPVPVPTGVISSLKSQEDASGFVRRAKCFFRPGQRVEILDGPMAMHIGSFQRVSDNERVVLLLNLLGRKVNVTIPSVAVAAA